MSANVCDTDEADRFLSLPFVPLLGAVASILKWTVLFAPFLTKTLISLSKSVKKSFSLSSFPYFN